jgi:hypothetical protein
MDVQQLANYFNQEGYNPEAKNLWNLVTALRGPDIIHPITCNCGQASSLSSYELKFGATAVIRYHFLKASGREPANVMTSPNIPAPSGSLHGSWYQADSEEALSYRQKLDHIYICGVITGDNPKHFRTHARLAFDTLNLGWNVVNSPREAEAS